MLRFGACSDCAFFTSGDYSLIFCPLTPQVSKTSDFCHLSYTSFKRQQTHRAHLVSVCLSKTELCLSDPCLLFHQALLNLPMQV